MLPLSVVRVDDDTSAPSRDQGRYAFSHPQIVDDDATWACRRGPTSFQSSQAWTTTRLPIGWNRVELSVDPIVDEPPLETAI